jgi:hypothetical protein
MILRETDISERYTRPAKRVRSRTEESAAPPREYHYAPSGAASLAAEGSSALPLPGQPS